MTLPPSAPVYLAFALWFVLCFAIVARWRNARGVIAALLGAWLLLPQATIRFPYIFYTTKMIAVTLVLLAAVCVLDIQRLKQFRPRPIDVPMGLFCILPFFSALVNGFSVSDALQFTLTQVCAWGIPYLLGRLYLTDLDAARDLAVGIVIGGALYIPLCWYEIFSGPVLHTRLYGFPASAIDMEVRFGGWRPVVFQLHGLMVGLFMAAATVCAFWLFHTRAVVRIWKFPMLSIFLALAITTIAVKSVNGWVLGLAGILFLWTTARLPAGKMLGALAASIVTYLGLRITGAWNAQELSAAGQILAGKELSLYYRVLYESLITERARTHWLWGWGSNERAMVRDYLGRIQTISDSDWIAVYGVWGLVGLLTWLAAFALPLLLFIRTFPSSLWRSERVAPAAALLTIIVMYFLDSLLNTMLNPIYVFALGGLACLAFLNQDQHHAGDG